MFMMQSLLKKFWISMIAIMGIFAIIAFWADISKLKKAIYIFDLGYLSNVILLLLCIYAIKFFKWHLFIQNIDTVIPFKDSLKIYLSGSALAVTPGRLGELLKSYLLKKKFGISYYLSAPIIFFERLTDLIAMIILGCFGAILYPEWEYLCVTLLGIVILCIWFFFSRNGLKFLFFSMRYIKKKAARKVVYSHRNMKIVNQNAVFFKTVICSIIARFLECMILYYVAKAFHFEMPIMQAIFIYSWSAVAGGVSMLPGGIGAAEMSIAGLLIFFGLERATATGISLVSRMGIFWSSVFLGVITVYLNKSFFLNEKSSKV